MALNTKNGRKGILLTLLTIVIFILMLSELITYVTININYSNLAGQTSSVLSSSKFAQSLPYAMDAYLQASLDEAAVVYRAQNCVGAINNITPEMQSLIMNGQMCNAAQPAMAGATIPIYINALKQWASQQQLSLGINNGTLSVYQSSPYIVTATYTAQVVMNSSYGTFVYPLTATAAEIMGSPPALSSNAIYVPILLSNGQGTATTPNFQELITITSSSYSSYIYSNWSNVEFTSGAPLGSSGSVPLYSWIESNAVNTATKTRVWVNLGSSTIGAAGSGSNTLTIYMNFLTSNSPITSGYTGYAPQMYCASGCFQTRYAQYDTGSVVFGFYDDFVAGSLNPGKWTSTGSPTVSNGVTVGGSSSIKSVPTINQQTTISEYYGYLSAASSALGLTTSFSYLFWSAGTYGWSNYAFGDGITSPYSVQTSIPWGTTPYLFSIWSNSLSGDSIGMINYAQTLEPTAQTASGNLYSQGGNAYIQWVRTRSIPPGGVMPSATAGPVI